MYRGGLARNRQCVADFGGARGSGGRRRHARDRRGHEDGGADRGGAGGRGRRGPLRPGAHGVRRGDRAGTETVVDAAPGNRNRCKTVQMTMTADRVEHSGLPATLSVGELLAGYRSGRFTVAKVIGHVLERIAQAPERHVWISLLDRARINPYVQALESKSPESLPLYGIPFAIKDNIDLAGVLTTAACPDYAYMPEKSAHVVQRLIDAGAIPVGKTNLDQFATGLVGTRSPYGACRNSVNQEFVSGGSSSGSAVSVATGLVSFSLGTDTAGSGRVPA